MCAWEGSSEYTVLSPVSVAAKERRLNELQRVEKLQAKQNTAHGQEIVTKDTWKEVVYVSHMGHVIAH